MFGGVRKMTCSGTAELVRGGNKKRRKIQPNVEYASIYQERWIDTRE